MVPAGARAQSHRASPLEGFLPRGQRGEQRERERQSAQKVAEGPSEQTEEDEGQRPQKEEEEGQEKEKEGGSARGRRRPTDKPKTKSLLMGDHLNAEKAEGTCGYC